MSRALFVTVDIDADPDTVFQAIASSEGLASFWTPNVDLAGERDARVRLRARPR